MARPWLRFQKKRQTYSTDSFYQSKEWYKLAKYHKTLEPICRMCWEEKKEVKQAEISDHIKPVETHPHLKLELSNLQSLCRSCHNKKTANDKH